MIAAFWVDLTTDNNSQVYKLVTHDYVIIEWDNMETYQHNDDNSFQIILYNPEYLGYTTPTGDGQIKIQYSEFYNTTNGNYSIGAILHGCYATVGIENHLGNVGLQHTFNNVYDEAAMELSDGSAIFITTSTGVNFPGDVNQDESLDVLDVVLSVNFILGTVEPTLYQQMTGDMNTDGTVNILDVVIMVNMILGT